MRVSNSDHPVSPTLSAVHTMQRYSPSPVRAISPVETQEFVRYTDREGYTTTYLVGSPIYESIARRDPSILDLPTFTQERARSPVGYNGPYNTGSRRTARY